MIGEDEVTPSDSEPARTRNEGEWAQLTTGEHRLVQTVVKRERKQSIWKMLGVAGSSIALMQFFNTQGPCSTGWKFTTVEAAKLDMAANYSDHGEIRKETKAAVQRVEDKIDTGNSEIIKAIVDLKKGKNK